MTVLLLILLNRTEWIDCDDENIIVVVYDALKDVVTVCIHVNPFPGFV